jgi:hypothetical protein
MSIWFQYDLSTFFVWVVTAVRHINRYRPMNENVVPILTCIDYSSLILYIHSYIHTCMQSLYIVYVFFQSWMVGLKTQWFLNNSILIHSSVTLTLNAFLWFQSFIWIRLFWLFSILVLLWTGRTTTTCDRVKLYSWGESVQFYKNENSIGKHLL